MMTEKDALRRVREVLNDYACDHGTESAHERLGEIDEIVSAWERRVILPGKDQS